MFLEGHVVKGSSTFCLTPCVSGGERYRDVVCIVFTVALCRQPGVVGGHELQAHSRSVPSARSGGWA